jgi:DNA-binding NtrC family response regulator
MNSQEYPCILAVFADDPEQGKRIAEVLEECGFIPAAGPSLSDMKRVPSRFTALFGVPRTDDTNSLHSTPSRLDLSDVEKNHIRTVLDACGWKYKAAAKALGINRTTLYRKVKKYGIRKER